MPALHFALFETAVGHCALAWSDSGIAGVQLPELDAVATRSRMRERFPAASESQAPQSIQLPIDRIAGLLRGERDKLADLTLNMTGVPAFYQRVYALARDIAPGQTVTYGELATRLGEPGAARAVGQAMGRNPFAPVVPCHRVLAANGRSGGFSAHGGALTKLKMLEAECARFGTQAGLFDR